MATDHNFLVKNGLDIEGANATIVQDGSETRITSTGEIRFRPEGSSSNKVRITLNTTHISGSLDASANVDGNAFRINGTTVVDSSRNLTNIGTISSGKIEGTTADANGHILKTDSSTASASDVALQIRNSSADYNLKFQPRLPAGNMHSGVNADDFGIFTSNSKGISIGNNDKSLVVIHPTDGIEFHTNNANRFNITTAGNLQLNGTTVIDASRNISAGRGTFVGNAATPAGLNALNVLSAANGQGVAITFSDNGSPPAANTGQRGTLQYFHSDSASYGSGNSFVLQGTESTLTVLADGKLMFKEGLYVKPSSGTGAGTQIIDSSRNLTSIGTISNTGRIASSIGSNATYSRPLLEITSGSTPTQIKITTNIPFSGTTHAHAVKISGFQYGSRNTADLQIAWHVYNNSFYNRIATSSGSWAPTITLAVENNKVVIHLASPGYWPKLYVESLYNAFGGNTHANSWSWADSAISADANTPNETVPYKAAFGNSLSMDMDGNWLVDSGYVRSSDGYKISTTTVIDSNRNLTNLANISAEGYLDLRDTNGTAGHSIHLPRSGRITFYGDSNSHHSISSRDISGNAADDLTISSYGALNIDLDSNNNNTSGADFVIARHGSTTPLYTMSGETGDITTTGHIVLANDHDLSFKKSDGTSDGTIITRATGEAMRVKYNANAFIFDALGNHDWRIYNSAGESILTTSGMGTQSSSSVRVFGQLQIGTTTVIDNSRNLVNIGTINTGQGNTEVHLMNQNVRTTDSPTFADLTITGNLSITGDINSYNVTDLDVTDKTITLGAGQTEANSGGSGIIIDGSGASLLWDEADNYWAMNKKLAFDTTATTTNQALGIRWTAFDKEGTTDFSDVAEIIHTTNTGGHAGSVLLIKSENDSGDGIAFSTHSSSYLKHNSSNILTVANFNTLMSSSLNAGTLDSLDSSQFLRSDADDTASGNITITGSGAKALTVGNGSARREIKVNSSQWPEVTFYNASTENVRIGSAQTSSTYNTTEGDFYVYAPSTNKMNLIVPEDGGSFTRYNGAYTIWDSGNDGSGSGLDADLLDGIQSGSFLRSDANDTATHTITFNNTPILAGTTSNEGGELNFGAPTGGVYSSFALDNYQGHFRVHTLQSGKNFQIIGAGESARTTINTNIGTVWGSNNDGASSGLDADLLDGVQGASYLRSDANDTYTGTLDLAGVIKDNGDSRNIRLMHGSTNSQPYIGVGEQGNYGMKIRWDSGTRIEFDGFWNTSVTGSRNRDLGSIDVNNANWEFPSGVTINGSTAWHAGNDGSGSGLDADLLDGQHGSYYTGGKGQNITYVASSTSTSNRGNHGAGVWAYSGYSTGSNRPFTYDATLQVMPTSGLGFELSVDWLSQTSTPIKIRSLRDCCQGWSNYSTIWTSSTDGSGSGLDADTVDGIQGANLLRSDTSDTMNGTLTVTGNVSHTGLTMTSGTDVDQLYSATKSITLSTSWQDTGIIFNNLATGSYIIQVSVNDHAVGGQQYSEMYTGVMSWYASGTNSTVTDEILLHRAGHAPNAGDIFLRTARVTGNTSPNLHLEIRGSTSNTGASNYVFKFRRMI